MVRHLEQVDMDTLVSLCKRRGLIFPGSEIYGGLGSLWDYGPLGVELKRNVRDAWWRSVVWERDDIVGLDAAILMAAKVWEASGHVQGFTDPLVECKACHQRFRADHLMLWEYWCIDDNGRHFIGYSTESRSDVNPPEPSDAAQKAAADLARKHNCDAMDIVNAGRVDPKDSRARCPSCGGELTDPRQFNLMFKTFVGPVEDSASQAWLRPETAQGIFVNFDNVLTSSRRKLPFGIAQIGKSFRNEITPGNFIFRTREFEQMEIEFFVKPGTDEEWHRHWLDERMRWYTNLGIRPDNLRLRRHDPDELSHYAKGTYDIEYRFPWGWGELEGIANRTNFDLTQHQQHSGRSLDYYDEETKERFVPYVIEPSGGVDRALLAFLVDAYDEEPDPGPEKSGVRTVLRLHPALAPVKVAVLPLSRNEKLAPTTREVYQMLRKTGRWHVDYDDAQSIGRRYRRQDEIGTPYCVTVDFQTVEGDPDAIGTVTIRDRDTMEQVRVPIDDLVDTLRQRLEG